MGDNRIYSWESIEIVKRSEYPLLINWIRSGSEVIDLGCGNGSLLRILQKDKGVICSGIELSESGVDICRKHGLNVRQGRIDVDLTDIPDNAYEYSICNVTIQMVMNPEITLKEMKRIAKYQILSFPNFAFILQRIDLLFNGRMPRKLLYGYDWYSTGHIHQLSVKDFRKTVAEMGLKILDSAYLIGRHKMPVTFMPNLFATAGIFLLEKK
jgi:methionine biosynthesis protein MetW